MRAERRPYDLLIFDWDGTLADSAAMIVADFQKAIAKLGLPGRTDAQIRVLIGLGVAEAMNQLYPEFAPEDVLKALSDYRRQLVASGANWHGPAEAPLFEGALAVLQGLRSAGYRLCVATGKSRASLRRSFVRHPEVEAVFAASRCADETADKPDPLMLRELLDLEEVGPDRALMIGDAEYDMAMARAIGVHGLGVACGVHDRQRLLGSGAEDLIEDVRELPDWLARRRSQGNARPA